MRNTTGRWRLRSQHVLARGRLTEQILYIVTTAGVPLKIRGTGEPLRTTAASVDSELALLYGDLKGTKHPLPRPLANPFFARRSQPFRHPDFPIYLVTRLAGYDFADIRGLVDRSLAARNEGEFVLDLSAGDDAPGNNWLRDAYIALPRDRAVFDQSKTVLEGVRDVIGYGAWGSNDKSRHKRHLGFSWLPGAIVTEYVSTNGRTFSRPPDAWETGTWADKSTWFAGSPQTLTADYTTRRRDRGVRPRIRTVSRIHAPPRLSIPGVLLGAQPGGKLLSVDPGLELAEYRRRRSVVLVGKTALMRRKPVSDCGGY